MDRVKIIVADLDGTLLRSTGNVSEYTATVFEKCRNAGILTVIATARPVRGARAFYDVLHCNGAVFQNGAVILENGVLNHIYSIPNHTAVDILKRINKNLPDVLTVADMNDVLFANYDLSTIWDNIRFKITDYSDFPCAPVEKIMIGTHREQDMAEIIKLLPDNLFVNRLSGGFYTITNILATKFNAVKSIARSNQVDIKDIAAFGDGRDDIELLRKAGIGIAMFNADMAVRSAADDITGTNDEDGVARFIANRLL